MFDSHSPLEDKQREYGTSYGEAVSIWRIKLAWTQFSILDELYVASSPSRAPLG